MSIVHKGYGRDAMGEYQKLLAERDALREDLRAREDKEMERDAQIRELTADLRDMRRDIADIVKAFHTGQRLSSAIARADTWLCPSVPND